MLIESFSGIRGVWNQDLNINIVKKYAFSYFQYLVSQNLPLKLVIGRDSRESGKIISDIIFQIWKSLGGEVIDIGIFPTPVVEFAVRFFDASGGVIITASHNEPEYNGFKFLGSSGGVLYPEEIAKVIELKRTVKIVNVENIFEINVIDHKKLINAYIDFLKNIIGNLNFGGKKVLIDPNGGSLATCYSQIFQAFGVEVNVVGEKVGCFWRKVEPKEEYLQEVPKYFDEDTLFAACFDCDADRVEFVLRNGKVVSGQHVLSILLETLLPKSNNKTVVTNDATSGMVREVIEKYGGKMVEVEVGEANVVKEMERLSATLGGEGSSGGGIVFPNRCRDGILSTLIVCKYLKQTGKTLEQCMDDLPKYITHVEKWTGKDVQKLRKKLKQLAVEKGFKIVTTGDGDGGMKVYFDKTSWIWIRESKTESGVVRCIVDGKNERKVLEVKKVLERLF